MCMCMRVCRCACVCVNNGDREHGAQVIIHVGSAEK